MKKKLLIISLCSLLLVCSGCKQEVELKDGKEVVASVKGKKITAEELFDELKSIYGSNAVVSMVDNFIVTKEIKSEEEINEAEEYAKGQVASMKSQYESAGYDWNSTLSQYGYDSEKDLVDEYANEYKKELAAKKFIGKKVTEDEINKYYEKEIYGNYTVKHILIAPETTDNMSDEQIEEAEKKALEKAKKVIKKLDEGSKWADLVKEYSDDTGSVEDEGLIKDFTKGDMVDEFFEASVKLEDGKYTKEPVESTYGYHIILKVSNTKKPSLKESKNKILKEIAENKLKNDSDLYNKTWKEIRESYNFKIADTEVEKAYKKSLVSKSNEE